MQLDSPPGFVSERASRPAPGATTDLESERLPSEPSLAVYVHIPWCASLCPYCDFDKQAHDFGLIDAYLDAVVRQIEQTPRRPAHSLYFGGGTPSLLTVPRLTRVIDACREHFEFSTTAEITVEANPSDTVAHKIEGYLGAGVNRISLGIQSLVDEELRFLGRRHTADKARRAVRAVREAGCANLSLDLMYGVKGQTPSRLQASIDGLLELNPEHLSAYALTLEPTTPMGAELASGRLTLPSDDAVADAYTQIQAAFQTAGFEQYEVSNWARPGHQSVHNLTYWRNGEWVGLGAGASGSCFGGRYKRNPDIRAYIASTHSGDPAYVESEPWTPGQQMRDTLMLGLRLAEGVDDAAFRERYGRSVREFCSARLDNLVSAGLLHWEESRLVLDPGSYFVCNAILAEILPNS